MEKEREAEKSPVNYKEDVLNKTVTHQMKTQVDFTQKFNKSLAAWRESQATLDSRPTESQLKKARLKDPVFDDLDKPFRKQPGLTKNSENVRQVRLKLDKTADNFILKFDETGQQYRENMKILNWQ